MQSTPLIRARVQVLLLAALMVARGALHPAAQNSTQDHAGQYAQSDIVYGSQLYAAQCNTCHGANGDAVGGVNLRSGPIRRATTDAELGRLIGTGIPGSGMPAFRLNQAEQAGIVAYIRNMNAFDVGSVKLGDAARGRTAFEGKGQCLTCHAVDDKGSFVAPDLSGIGASRAPSMLERHLADPSAQMMPVNRPVRAVTRKGPVVNGRRLNEDTYSVQLMDDHGDLVSLLKADLLRFEISSKSPMPSYKDKLNPGELADVVAYLLTLKGS